MYCGRCGWAVVPGDRTCRRCGVSFGLNVPTPQLNAGGRKPWKAAALVAGLAGLMALGLAMNQLKSSVLGQKGKAPTAQMVAQGMGHAPAVLAGLVESVPAQPMLASQGFAPAPQLQSAVIPEGLPANVAGWLGHLQRIENARAELSARQASEAAGVYAEMLATKGVDMNRLAEGDLDAIPEDRTQPSRQAAQQNRGVESAWAQLARDYASVPPPSECSAIGSSYSQLLTGTQTMVAEISSALDSVQSDPQAALSKVMAMQGQSSRRVDAHAKAANRQLRDLCARYRVDQPFEIQSDFGGGLFASR